jgi:nucleotide-binding universal stress UspA family protein
MDSTYLMVVGVDGSAHGRRALEWAAAEAAHRTRSGLPTSVEAVTCWQYDPLARPESVEIRLPDPRVAAEQMLRHAISDVCAAYPDVAVAGEAVEGNAADALVRAASTADLLVLGSHGHSQAFHAVLGSVAAACVRNSTRPVLIIPVARSTSGTPTDLVATTVEG